ncbi:DUF6328 family protein [Streptacidiphilus sp. ASG 303]|uniref:DUF6328 family protein n=1 Tax=Streptacidiphilus sp. ASG 303 TaxID=2896847 RepID=UPI001E35DD05|nr:DUF6328 family protein [Streptacidiphilus sp. ASG 303]MCD0480850.1 DUF6328 family protein [Streptacidiphilus sp. ASG 303]
MSAPTRAESQDAEDRDGSGRAPAAADRDAGGAPAGGAADGGTRAAAGDDEETPKERADRRWNELIQEVRVAQTGVQILLGFLLSVAFTPRFAELGGADRTVYVVTVVLGAATTGALIAPVALHRMLSGLRLKSEVVDVAARLTALGMALLAVTLVSALLLLLHVATGSAAAEWIVAGVAVWFGICWYALPAWLRRRGERRSGAAERDAG